MKIACCIKCCWDQVGVMVENSFYVGGYECEKWRGGVRSDNWGGGVAYEG